MLTYSNQGFTIPPHMMTHLMAYVQNGAPVGDFLFSVLSNNFCKAVFHADGTNLKELPAYAWFVYNRMPQHSHGSPEKVEAWIARFQEGGIWHGKTFEWDWGR